MRKDLRVAGWFLLLFGVSIILWALYSSYSIFTDKVKAPEIFKVEEKKKIPTTDQPSTSPQAQMERMFQEQLKTLFPPEIFFRFLNLISWTIFTGMITFGGSQIATLGIKLLK